MLTAPHELFSEEFLRDPYPMFAWLRREQPVYWSKSYEAFIVTRYDDCVAILTDPDRFGPVPDPTPRVESSEHVLYRNLVGRAFNAEFVARLAPGVRRIAEDLIDGFVDGGQVDLMPAFADRLPTLVLAEMLGIPPQDQPTFLAWAAVYTHSLTNQLDSGGRAAFLATIRELVAYFAYRIEERRRHPGDDLITRLTQARAGDVELSPARILSLCEQFMVAGRDLTAGLIGNCMRALLTDTRHLQRVLAQPAAIAAAVEETLRWDSPVLGQPRTNRTDMELRGVRLRPGDLVIVMFAAANRDPEVFAAPNTFDMHRPNAPLHLAFGRGSHFCLGAPLARLEATIALSSLLARLPRIRQVPELAALRRVAFAMLNLRTYGALPVAFDPPRGK